MNLYTDTFPTPCGDFSLAVNETGALVATAFGNVAALESRLPQFHLIGETASRAIAGQFHLISEIAKTRSAREQVLAYFAGERREFDLPLAAMGTPFQHRVWAALRAIPCGETRSYGELAAQLGRPHAARAVGRANATNPICLIVPCHRVIGRDGSLTGFAFGEKTKARLLEHERTLSAAAHAA